MTPDLELLDATAWAFLAKTVKSVIFCTEAVLSAGAPEEIRTPDPQTRSLELQVSATDGCSVTYHCANPPPARPRLSL